MKSSGPGAAPAHYAVFVRLSSRPIPRVTRMMDVANELGYETLFIGARREPGLTDREKVGHHEVKRLGPYFPLLNGRSPVLYIRSIVSYNLSLLKFLNRENPEIVHASDIETMFASVVYSTLRGRVLIYNIHDNLSQRYRINIFAQFLLNFLEGGAVLFSSTTLVPERFRRQSLPWWCRSRVKVIRNTPSDRGYKEPVHLKYPIRIFFGGWLDKGRGILQLLDLVRENDDFQLVIAGEGDKDLLDDINVSPRVEYLGFVSHDEIMEETAKCHFVSALYDPSRSINRYAASNKLAEALATGRPTLINSEMEIRSDLEIFNCLVALPYADVRRGAASAMRELVNGPQGEYVSACENARRAYESLYSWDEARREMEDVLRIPSVSKVTSGG